jgi:hypothetical protein
LQVKSLIRKGEPKPTLDDNVVATSDASPDAKKSFKTGTSTIEEELYSIGLAHQAAVRLCMPDTIKTFTTHLLKQVDKSQQVRAPPRWFSPTVARRCRRS